MPKSTDLVKKTSQSTLHVVLGGVLLIALLAVAIPIGRVSYMQRQGKQLDQTLPRHRLVLETARLSYARFGIAHAPVLVLVDGPVDGQWPPFSRSAAGRSVIVFQAQDLNGRRFTDDELRAITAHEAAHVANADWARRILVRAWAQPAIYKRHELEADAAAAVVVGCAPILHLFEHHAVKSSDEDPHPSSAERISHLRTTVCRASGNPPR